MAEAVVSIALQTLGDLLIEKGKLLFAVGDEVNALQTQLKEIKCFLKDADANQHKSETVRNWIAEIRDLAYRSEDVVEEYSFRMSWSSSSHGWGRRLLHGGSGVRHSSSLLQLSSQMLHIKLELERITKDMKEYGINKIIDGPAVSSDNQILARKAFPNFVIGDCFVGKEEELKRLVSLVVDDKEHPVIAVWGMGGIGKTTIAKKVYNQMKEAKNSRFDCFVWVCISQQCQIRTVLEDILKQMEGGSVSDLSDVQLNDRLCQIQINKRCLIVVDDLWEISHWNALKNAFPLNNLQSKILVTTRIQKVAEIGFSLKLGLLNREEGLELLQKKAFPHGHILADFQLGKIGKEMVKKCGYLPLAISLLGGVLSKRKSMAELMLVKENVSAYLYRGDGNIEGENEMHAVLNLSYEDLPYYLKPCFLYLGILKEDQFIDVNMLYKRWIAQGMISDEMIRGEETLVDIAELYLGELASRCMLQVENEWQCKLHDVVREFCLSTGKKEEFGVQVLEYRHGNFGSLLPVASHSINKTRHLVIHFPAEVIRPKGGGDLTISNCEHLRSLEILTQSRWDYIQFPPESIIYFDKFKVLRELLIENFSFEGRKLPRGITKLVHLRYFGLRRCGHLDKLPSSICNLVYLETLDLFLSRNIRVPNVFRKMRRFKHLILPFYSYAGYYRLRLDEGVDELETLEEFDSRVHELKSTVRMKNLRRFNGVIYDNKSLSAIVNAIGEHSNKLQFCSLQIREDCQLRSSSDEVLRLEECEIEDPMPMGILGNLHCLTHLTIERSHVGEEMTCHASSFPHLMSLYLSGLEKLREWRVEQGAMPLLSELEIVDCSNLREWRVEQGAMPLLSKLYIRKCPRLKKVPDEVSSISAEDKLNIIERNLSGINFSSISEYQREQQFAEEITDEDLTLTEEDSEEEMFRHMPMSLSGFDSQKRVEPECHGEIEAVDELTTEIDVEKEQQFGEEITVEGLTLTQEDSEAEMFRHMPIPLSGFDSQKRVEPESHGEIQVVDELTTEIDAEKVSGEQRGTERSKHHEEGISFQEKNPYLVTVEDNHLQLKLDNLQTFLIVDGLDISLANAVLNWAEQDLRELPENPNYPNSLLLFLQRNRRLTLIHPSFFDSMPDLQFLDISDTKIRILPGSLFNLSKLKVLLLRNCACLDNLPREIGKLNQLEALDLSGTELYDMPDAIGELGLLRSMQLSFYGPDDESEYQHLPSQLISPSFLSELKEIQALSISVHPEDHRWTEIVARVINDVSKLEMLSYLQFYFPQVEMFETFIQTSPSWEKQKVSKFDFIVGQNVKRIASRVPDEVESLFNQHERCLRYVNGDRASPLIKTVLIRATAFYLDHHTEVQSLSEFDISNLQELKFCVVRECPKIQTILDEKNVVGAFPCLEHLQIYFLWELKQIWQPPSPGRLKRIFRTSRPSGNFEALRYLIINTCPKLQFILWECMLQCLTNLEELVVEDCERVEKIIKEEKRKVKYENNVLPRLRKLVLHYLPELVSVGNGVCLSEEKISVYGCPKLIHSSQFPNLPHSNIAEE